MKKILVPTDFSKPSEWSTEVARVIAKKANAEVILFHVIEKDMPEAFNAEGQIDTDESWEEKRFMLKLIERRRDQLQAICTSLENDGIKAQKELSLGIPFRGIEKVIAAHQVDLIVMGISGYSRFEEMLFGSKAQKVVRYSRCPVLTVHQRHAPMNFENIVYATSLLEDEPGFTGVVKNIQAIFNAKIHVVRINTPSNFQSDAEVRRALEKFADTNKLENYTLNVFNDQNEEQGIIHFADSISADMIAMATHGRIGLARMLKGSITEGIVNHSVRPVMSYVMR